MSQAEEKFREIRAERNVARAAFDSRLAAVKADYAARGISGRVTDRVTAEAMDALHSGLDVAKDQKAMIGATAGATVGMIVLWLCRKPVITAIISALRSDEPAQ